MTIIAITIAIVSIVLLWKVDFARALFKFGAVAVLLISCTISIQGIVIMSTKYAPEPEAPQEQASSYAEQIKENASNQDIAQLMYKTKPSQTQSGLHGLAGFQGYDYSMGCSTPIYAPISGIVTYSGLDGYNHFDGEKTWPQATMLTIDGEAGSWTVLHSDIKVTTGTEVNGGELVASEASIGWSTGCHSHVIWRPNASYRKPDIVAISSEQRSATGIARVTDTSFQDTGYISAYDREPTDGTIVNRKKWGQIPQNVDGYALIAVLDCNRIGQIGTLETHQTTLDVLVFDCAGIEDGGASWMIEGDYVVEVDYYTRIKYPEIIGTVGTLRLKE